MIDYDTLKETSQGHRRDQLTALLIGLIAIVAAALVVIQTTASLDEARANAQARRLASELTTRSQAGGMLLSYQLINGQRALAVSMQGTSRQIVSLTTGDPALEAIGGAQTSAGTRLMEIAAAMWAVPGRDSPLDAYAVSMLSGDMDVLQAVGTEQGRQADLAIEASGRSNDAVLGLSLAALAGVLVGLAAVLGRGRAGNALLVLAWGAALGATALLAMAAGVGGLAGG